MQNLACSILQKLTGRKHKVSVKVGRLSCKNKKSCYCLRKILLEKCTFTVSKFIQKNMAMKKIFLFLATSSIALSSFAQERAAISVSASTIEPTTSSIDVVRGRDLSPYLESVRNKTTGPTTRWYSYGGYFAEIMGAGSVQGDDLFLWNDTLAQLRYRDVASGPIYYAHNKFVSMGGVFHPQSESSFNRADVYSGAMKIDTTNAYVIDSINLTGYYVLNPAKSSIKDTLIITLVYGSTSVSGDGIYKNWFKGTVPGNYGLASTDSLVCANMFYDSITNTASDPGGRELTWKFVLSNANYGDTLSNGLFSKSIPVNGTTGFAVPANNMAGVSISFKSGDPAFVPHDSVVSSVGIRYNSWRPLIYYAGTSTAVSFPPYSKTDMNCGQFKRLPNSENGWTDSYIPQYAWSSTGGASFLQHATVDFHVKCPTCATVSVPAVQNPVSNVTAFPSPANDKLNVVYTSSSAITGTVTLTNAIGQVVATEAFSNTTNGKSVFNTANLADGMYIYTINANGVRSTGRVAIAH
jgi:hypothetical protein